MPWFAAVVAPCGASRQVAQTLLPGWLCGNKLHCQPPFSFFPLLRPAGNIPVGVMDPCAFMQIHMAVLRRCAEKVIGKERILCWMFGVVESVLISCSRLENSFNSCFSKQSFPMNDKKLGGVSLVF